MSGPPANRAVLLARDLVKTFSRKQGDVVRALDDISLTVRPGTITALVGPDGAGKTTLLAANRRVVVRRLGHADRPGHRRPSGPAERPESHRVYAAAVRLVRRPQRRGESEPVCRSARRDRGRAARALSATHGDDRIGTVCPPAGRAAFRRHEAETGAGLHARPLAGVAAVGRANRGRRSAFETRTVGDHPATLRRTASVRLVEHSLPGRSPALRRGHRAAPGPGLDAGLAGGRQRVGNRPNVSRPAVRRTNSPRIAGRSVGQAGRRRCRARGRARAAWCWPTAPAAGRLPDGITEKASSEPTAPRFEDGFMILLRKANGDGAETHLVPLAHLPQAANGEAVVEVHDLVRKFGSFTAVDHLSFEVRQGEVFGLLGPNGAGKTTTFRMLCGLLPATAGTLRVAGADLRVARASARQRIGYVAQKFSLYAQLSVLENIEFFCGAYGLRGQTPARAGPLGARSVRAAAVCQLAQRPASRRLQAAAGHGRGAGARAGHSVSRRTHQRRRPARPARILAAHHGAGGTGRNGDRNNALHGRGRVLRPRGDSGRRQDPGPGHSRRIASPRLGRDGTRADDGRRVHRRSRTGASRSGRPNRTPKGRSAADSRTRLAMDAPQSARAPGPWWAKRPGKCFATPAASPSASCCRWC